MADHGCSSSGEPLQNQLLTRNSGSSAQLSKGVSLTGMSCRPLGNIAWDVSPSQGPAEGGCKHRSVCRCCSTRCRPGCGLHYSLQGQSTGADVVSHLQALQGQAGAYHPQGCCKQACQAFPGHQGFPSLQACCQASAPQEQPLPTARHGLWGPSEHAFHERDRTGCSSCSQSLSCLSDCDTVLSLSGAHVVARQVGSKADRV